MAIYKYPADLDDLNAAAGLESGSSSRSRMKDLMVMRIQDSQSTSVNPYSNVTPRSGSGGAAAKASIWLYMPQSINASYSVEYADINLGVIGKGALSGYKNFENGDGAAIGEQLKSMASGMLSEVQMGTVGSAIGLANGALGLGGDSLSGSDVSAILDRKAFNPYLENVFKGVGFRQHPFQFKLLVRSKAEGEQVKGIIKTLKEAMHPEFGSSATAGDNRFLTIPDIFQISFLRNSGSSSATEVLYKFKPCVLTSLNVNYTPDGYYAVPGDLLLNDWDNISLSVDIQMQFKETQILTKKDFKDTITF